MIIDIGKIIYLDGSRNPNFNWQVIVIQPFDTDVITEEVRKHIEDRITKWNIERDELNLSWEIGEYLLEHKFVKIIDTDYCFSRNDEDNDDPEEWK